MEPDQAVDHIYTPFSQPTEIRIAIIEPSMEHDAPLRFSFHQALLEDLEGRYEAVSYVWGLPILAFPVHHTTDRSRVYVTENLDHALRRLRHRLDPRWLWADAMCIDQKNDREKEVQIPLMVDIFRGARRVLAWLHRGDEAVERGMRCIDHMSRQSVTSRGGFVEERSRRSALSDVKSFIGLPYFQRLWIVQEIVFNVDIILLCGKSELSWLRLVNGLMKINNKRPTDDEALTKSLNTMAQVWQINHTSPEPDLSSEHILELVQRFSSNKCTDDRDRIFAVHSLSGKNNARMSIDYSFDVHETYRRFALACVVDGRILEILGAASARLDLDSSTTWPSWIPDLRHVPTKPLSDARIDRETLRFISIGNVIADSLELEIDFCMTQPDEEGRFQHLVVQANDIVHMGTSLPEFLNELMRLYQRCRPDPKHQIMECINVVHYMYEEFWPPSYREENLGYLRRYMSSLWEITFLGTYQREYEKVLIGPISKIMEDRCWFLVESKDNRHTFMCYGNGAIIHGDIVIPVTWGLGGSRHEYSLCEKYLTYIFRPSSTLSDEHAYMPHNDHREIIPYRLIGEAILIHIGQVSARDLQGEKLYIC